MDPASIALLVSGILAAAGGSYVVGKRIVDKVKKKREDNSNVADWLTTALEIWSEEKEEIQEIVSQFMIASKAIDKQTSAVDKINQNAALRKKLLEDAAAISPETASDLAEALKPIPQEFRVIGGAHLDKLTQIKNAQREELSAKDATNRMLARSGDMARNIAEAVKKVAPLIIKK